MTDSVEVFLGDIKCELRRLEPKSGDVLVLTVHGELSEETVRRIQSEWKRCFPDLDVRVAVLTDGMTADVVHAEELAQ